MTRKSAGRLKKDADKKHIQDIANGKGHTNGWDVLNDLHGQCVKLLVSHTLTRTILADKELYTCFKDTAAVVANIRLLAKDITDHTQHLADIYAKHSNRTGGERNPDEGMTVIELHEAYSAWMTAHDALIMPTWMEIMDAVAHAEVVLRERKGLNPEQVKAREEKAAADAIDPNVITDVVVNEVVPQEQ